MSLEYINGSKFDYNYIKSNEIGVITKLTPIYVGIPVNKQNVVDSYTSYSNYKSHYEDFTKKYKNNKIGLTISAGLYINSSDVRILNAITNQNQRNLLNDAKGKLNESALDWLWYNQKNFGVLSPEDNDRMMNEYFKINYWYVKNKIKSLDSLDYKLRTAAMEMAHGGAGSSYISNAYIYFNNGDIGGLIKYLRTFAINTTDPNFTKARVTKLINYISSSYTPSSYEDTLKSKDEVVDEDASVASYDTYSIAIGNEWVLSNYNANQGTVEYFTRILKKAKIDDDSINEITKAFGVYNNEATAIANTSNVNLTNAQCDDIFTQLMYENLTRMQDNFNYVLTDHPIEVNSAIMSYIFDTNLNDEEIVNEEIRPIIELLKNKAYDELASFIESHGFGSRTKYNGAAVNIIGELNRLVERRTKEANLIRSRKSDKPNYIKDNSLSNEIGNPDEYMSKLEKEHYSDTLSDENAKKQALYSYRDYVNSKNPNYTNQDEAYGEINKEVADNYAEMYQIHQITLDGIAMDGELDYEYRLRVKKFYNLETRNKNISYVAVENEVMENGGDVEQLSSSYDYIPYGTNMFKDIKKNAVERCRYRIKKLKKEIGDITEEVTSYGIFDLNLTNEELVILALATPELAVIIAILQALFGDYRYKVSVLNEEEKNLKYLLKELDRFNKTN